MKPTAVKVQEMTTPTSGLTWSELIALEGPDLVRACYREILQREPDEAGFVHHVTALSNGASKAALIGSIASSDEACLSGRALSPIAVRARDALSQEVGNAPSWLRRGPAKKVYRVIQEAMLKRRAASLQERATHSPAPHGHQSAQPIVRISRVPKSEWEAAIRQAHSVAGPGPDLWFDLTTAFQWTGGVVGIVRAELELACGLKKIHPAVRFSMQVDQGFVEIPHSEIKWLLDAPNVADAYMTFFGRYPGLERTDRSLHLSAPAREGFFHPYRPGDAIVAAGWMDSQKEIYFARLKDEIPSIYLAYLIYDIIMLLDETRHFYPRDGRERFVKYIEWASAHCDMLLYGGRTAQRDTEAYLKQRGLNVPPGTPVQFGTDIVKAPTGAAGRALLDDLGVSKKFVLTVGSIEPRKNHETLYRAYLMALEESGDELPQLVVVGKPMWRAHDLMNILTRHPELKGRVLCLKATDLELAALYENCLFTLLPSLYEGWSLTLPESLGQGKFCLCSDTPPLREIGGDLVDYAEPFDVKGWAEKLVLYSSDKGLLTERTAKVVAEWPTTYWVDTAKMLFDAVTEHRTEANTRSSPSSSTGGVRKGGKARSERQPTPKWTPPTIWMDVTLSFLHWKGGISGIVRAELELARHLKSLRPDTRFFANQMGDDYFFEVDPSYLKWLFEAEDVTKAYKSFHDFWLPREEEGSGYRNPFFQQHRPIEGHPAYLPSFPPNSVVFFAGIDSDGTGTLHRSKDVEALIEPGSSVITSQLIYDLTPFNCPQFHTEPTCRGFHAFFDRVSNHFDHIVYGGRTAQTDGIEVQERLGWRSPASGFIEFGSDIKTVEQAHVSDVFRSDEQVLAELGITSDFVITVGTIEPRKNHEVLYKAFLTLLRQKRLQNPLQMMFVGKPGWNSADFLATLEDDDRVRGRILIMSPTDEQLDLLYRRCLFTLLPSFYEGWSLTLPESLSYGKLCLASDVEPLREIGRDLADYIHPLDTYGWADRIARYANDPKSIQRMESRITSDWKARSWRESGQMLLDELDRVHRQRFEQQFASAA